MSYIKTTWETGDVVTAVKLNNIENGVENAEEKINSTHKISTDFLSEGSTNKLVTQTEKTTWNNKQNLIDGSNKLSSSLVDDTNQTNKFVTQTEKTTWNSVKKTWRDISLSRDDVKTLVQGGQVVCNFESSELYDPSNFKSDYFNVSVDQTTEQDGTLIYGEDDFNKVYIRLKGLDEVQPYLMSTMTNILIEDGFDHNYYQTTVLFAGYEPGDGGNKPILEGDGVIDGPNVIYVQDVSQQEWEYNIDIGDKDIKTTSREDLHATTFGNAFVFSIKGDDSSESSENNEFAFAYVLGKSQLSYWDTTTNTVKWAYTEPGKVYNVIFDGTLPGQHGTLRWLVPSNKLETSSEGLVYAIPMTDEEMTTLQNNPINFTSGLLTAYGIVDYSMKLEKNCYGVGDNYASKVFSFNNPFGDPETTHLEYIGRPIAYSLDTYTWYSEEWDEEEEEWVRTKHIEKNGYHIWLSDVQGVPISLIVPDNYQESSEGPVPHRDTYILEMDTSNLTSTETLYRHSFRINPSDYEGIDWTGEWKVYCAFSAVNTQMGDNTMDYILFSDESLQYPTPDWICPCSGKIGQCINSSGDVTHWYDISRIKATYTDYPTQEENPGVRCLRFEYFDDESSEMGIQQISAITANNFYKYIGYDFRSAIAHVKVPMRGVKY